MNREYRLLKKLKKGTLSEQEFDDEVSEELGDVASQGQASASKASSSIVQSNSKSHSKVKNRSAPRASKKRSS